MPYLGDLKKGDTVYHMWETTTTSGSYVNPSNYGTMVAYRNADTSQATGGIILTGGFDGLTGIHNIYVDTSNSFYQSASDYMVVGSGMVIDSTNVNAVIFTFSVENRSQATVSGVTAGAGIGTSANQTTITNNLATVSGNLLSMQGDVTTIAGDVVNIDGAAMRGTDSAALQTTLVTVSGDINDGVLASDISAAALTKIVASGDAAEWDGSNSTVSEILDTALTEIVNSGNAAGWDATSSSAAVTVSGHTPGALSEIVVSGNAANWNGTASGVGDWTAGERTEIKTILGVGTTNPGVISGLITDGVTVASLMAPVLTQIVNSGNAADWPGGDATLAQQAIIIDNLATTSGNVTTLTANVATVSGALVPLDSILTSGTAAGWISPTGDIQTIIDNVSTASGIVRDTNNRVQDLNSETEQISGVINTLSGVIRDTNTLTTAASGYTKFNYDLLMVASGTQSIINVNTANTKNKVTFISGVIDTLSGVIRNTNERAGMISGIIITISGNVATANTNISTIISNLATTSGVITTVSGAIVSLDDILTSGTAAGWADASGGVYVSGFTPGALSQVVVSGNAANWSGGASSLSTLSVNQIVSGVWQQDIDNGDFEVSGYAGQKMRNMYYLHLGAAQIVASGTSRYMRVYDNDTPVGTPLYTFKLLNFTGGNPTVNVSTITGRNRVST